EAVAEALRVKVTVKERDSLAHTLETAASTGQSGAVVAVVAYLDGEVLRAIRDGDESVGRSGVLHHIGQRLLHDAIGGQLDPRREGALWPLDGHPHADPCVPYLVDKRVE